MLEEGGETVGGGETWRHVSRIKEKDKIEALTKWKGSLATKLLRVETS